MIIVEKPNIYIVNIKDEINKDIDSLQFMRDFVIWFNINYTKYGLLYNYTPFTNNTEIAFELLGDITLLSSDEDNIIIKKENATKDNIKDLFYQLLYIYNTIDTSCNIKEKNNISVRIEENWESTTQEQYTETGENCYITKTFVADFTNVIKNKYNSLNLLKNFSLFFNKLYKLKQSIGFLCNEQEYGLYTMIINPKTTHEYSQKYINYFEHILNKVFKDFMVTKKKGLN